MKFFIYRLHEINTSSTEKHMAFTLNVLEPIKCQAPRRFQNLLYIVLREKEPQVSNLFCYFYLLPTQIFVCERYMYIHKHEYDVCRVRWSEGGRMPLMQSKQSHQHCCRWRDHRVSTLSWPWPSCSPGRL